MGYVYKNGVLHLAIPLWRMLLLNSRYPVLSSWTPSAQNFIFGSSLSSSNSFSGSLDDIKLYSVLCHLLRSVPSTVAALCLLVDVTAPSLPALFAATSLTSSKVNVGWESSTDAGSGIAGYSFTRTVPCIAS